MGIILSAYLFGSYGLIRGIYPPKGENERKEKIDAYF